jgi:hypothetical protein
MAMPNVKESFIVLCFLLLAAKLRNNPGFAKQNADKVGK